MPADPPNLATLANPAIPPDLAGALARVLAAYGLPAAVRPVHSGLINHTFVVDSDRGPVAVVQRLHTIFGAEVNLDLDAVTTHLASQGMDTPRLLRTRTGEAWVEADGVWRAITYVEGETLHRIADPATARAAGELVGRFHRAVDGLAHEYAFTRAGVHDTRAHLARLRDRLAADRAQPAHDGPGRGDAVMDAARALAGEILAAAEALPLLDRGLLDALPRRHTHGDLKISNLLFAPGNVRQARCLVDLDTLGQQRMAYELGDALRSWCNPLGEDTPAPAVDVDIFAAAMTGYWSGAGDLLTPEERDSIVPGLETVCVELAARFCVDVFDDAYFGWDPRRFGSRREHNLVRARGQVALARSVRAHRRVLESYL